MYELHPNAELRARFLRRPYQGAEPSKATFLFVGLDANYDRELEHSPAFSSVLDYHEDGPAFWRKHGIHHPFLLSSYSGDGRRYHRTFAKIGFTPQHANLVSFVELLHVPTFGRSQLNPSDLDTAHLETLNDVILSGRAKHVFVSAGVARLMRSTGKFSWLRRRVDEAATLPVLYTNVETTVYQHLHFSNYGKFEQQLNCERAAIAALIQADPRVRALAASKAAP